MFIWDFVADKILGQIVDWFYSQVVGFLGNFFSEMGSMGAELFEMNWVQSVVLFFSYLGWALFATGLVVAVFECGIEYSAGRGNVKETALNVLKGFLAVSLFTQVPVRLYSLAISLQGTLTAGITGFGSTSIGDAAKAALADLENLESLTESTYPLRGFGRETSGLMVLFCLILMAYAVIKVFFSNLKRGGMLCLPRERRKGAGYGRKEEPLRAHPAVAAPAASCGAGAAGPDPVRLHHGHTQRTF